MYTPFSKARTWTAIARKGDGEYIVVNLYVFETLEPKGEVFIRQLRFIKDEDSFLAEFPAFFMLKIGFPATIFLDLLKRPPKDWNDMRRWFLLMDMLRK
jgi:hypothetical protein